MRIKKAQAGVKKTKQPTPTYKNLRMGVNAKNSDGSGRVKEYKPTKEDSALYRFGFNRGLKGEKEYPGEPPVQKMGRWEGQNVKKKGMKSGGKLKAKGGAALKKQAAIAISMKKKGIKPKKSK